MNPQELAQAQMAKLGGGEMITVTFCDSARIPEIWLRGAVTDSDDEVTLVEIGNGHHASSCLHWRSGKIMDVGTLHFGFRKQARAEGRVFIRWLQGDGTYLVNETACSRGD
jgi:hypothetical protein